MLSIDANQFNKKVSHMTHFFIKLCYMTHPASETRATRGFQKCIKY